MAVVLPVLSVTFAAFSVWLTVRIVNRRERWAKWTACGVLLLAMVSYPLSIGPAAIWATDQRIRASDFTRFYYPLRLAAAECPLLDDFLDWYTDLCWSALSGND